MKILCREELILIRKKFIPKKSNGGMTQSWHPLQIIYMTCGGNSGISALDSGGVTSISHQKDFLNQTFTETAGSECCARRTPRLSVIKCNWVFVAGIQNTKSIESRKGRGSITVQPWLKNNEAVRQYYIYPLTKSYDICGNPHLEIYSYKFSSLLLLVIFTTFSGWLTSCLLSNFFPPSSFISGSP